MKKPSIICVANPIPIHGGGSLRALRSLREYPRYFKTYLFLLSSPFRREVRETVKELINSDTKISGYIEYPSFTQKMKFVSEVIQLLFPAVLKPCIGISDFDAVVALHETFDAINIGDVIGNLFEIPKLALLQLPPFYNSKKRLCSILRA